MENQFGKISELHLTAAPDSGKTILKDVSFTAPFKIMRPFYEKKDIMTVMLLTASAGIMAGDRQEIRIQVCPKAKMEFTSQAYEKIHRMEEGDARRDIHLSVGPEAYLSYAPLPAIPFAGSDYQSDLVAELADETSRFRLCEILTCGRAAHGEKFQYRSFRNRVSVYQAGKLVYRDNVCYKPKQDDMEGFGMYEGFTHLASLLICNEPKEKEWFAWVREMLDAQECMEGGVTVTAAGHIVVRILGMNGQKLENMMEKILEG